MGILKFACSLPHPQAEPGSPSLRLPKHHLQGLPCGYLEARLLTQQDVQPQATLHNTL